MSDDGDGDPGGERGRELLAQLREHRDDDTLWSVYADLLQTENDPRGALIAMMMQREQAPTPKLFAAERAYRKRHAAKLVPPSWQRHRIFTTPSAMAWWRGFPSGLVVTSPAQLADVISSPIASFVTTVRIQVDGDHETWVEALEAAAARAAHVPWRRLRLALDAASDETPLAPWLAIAPQLERLTVVCSPYDTPYLSFADASAPALRTLVVDNAGDVGGLDEVALPALVDLRLLGSSNAEQGEDFYDSELYAQLAAFAIGAEADAAEPPPRDGLTISHHTAPEDGYLEQDAFIAIRQLVERSLVEEIARELPRMPSLDVQVGHVVDGAESMTVIRAYTDTVDSLMPYGLAIAIAERLPPATPFVLFHSSHRTFAARACTLATPPSRATLPHEQGCELLRAMFDEQTGRDPGLDLLDDAVFALDCAPRTVLGTSPYSELAIDIDPSGLGPMPEYEDEFDDPLYPDSAADLFAPPVHASNPIEEAASAEAPSLGDAVQELDHELAADEAEADADVEVEAEGDPSIGDVTDGALRVDRLPDGRQAWLDLLSSWAERERDPDDELAPRFADPGLDDPDHPVLDLEKERAPAHCNSCAVEGVVLYPCVWCGGQHCASCLVRARPDDTAGGLWCHECIEELAGERQAVLANSQLTDDDLAALDAVVAEDEAELRAAEAALEVEAAIPDDDEYYER